MIIKALDYRICSSQKVILFSRLISCRVFLYSRICLLLNIIFNVVRSNLTGAITTVDWFREYGLNSATDMVVSVVDCLSLPFNYFFIYFIYQFLISDDLWISHDNDKLHSHSAKKNKMFFSQSLSFSLLTKVDLTNLFYKIVFGMYHAIELFFCVHPNHMLYLCTRLHLSSTSSIIGYNFSVR